MRKKILYLFISLLLVGCNSKADLSNKSSFNPELEEPSNRISMITAGDALIHSSIYTEASKGNNVYDFTSMLSLIKPIASSYDLAYYNQETIIGGKDLGLSNYPRFNSPDEIGDAMLDAGFNVVSLANNHTLDMNEKGVLYSVNNYWASKNALVAGSYNSFDSRNKIVVKELNGIKYALLSYTTTTNGLYAPNGKEYLVNVYDADTVKADIDRIKPYTDAIIVAMHWGNEYTHEPIQNQKDIASYLAGLGVNVIIGTHPHVVEPITFIGDTLVIYSLGNFLSGQIGIERLIGAMVNYDIVKTDEGIKIENVEAELIYTYYNNFRNYKIYPFSNLNNNVLPNYLNYYDTYSKILKRYDSNIVVKEPSY
jgi:poly-gamma-glutamate synthesis protein (capsule biosynthesis protein)